MDTTKFTTTINNNAVSVPEELAGYELYKRESSRVEYIGIHNANKTLYIQFKNGSGYIYLNCSEKLLTDAVNAKSIGSFVSKDLIGTNIKYKPVPYKITAV